VPPTTGHPTRHARLARTLSVALLVALAEAPAGGDEIPRSALGARTVRYAYEARFTPPEGARVVELAVPLPRADDQTVRGLELSGTVEPRTVTIAPSGDRVALVRVEAPVGPVVIRQSGTVVRRELVTDPRASAKTMKDVDGRALTAELAPSRFVPISDEVRAIATRETAGHDTVVTRARALYDWVYDHMQYDKSVPGWGLGDIPYCLKIGRGNCTDFHSLFIALARGSGIPARWNIGFPLAYDGRTAPATDAPVAGYHCWAEFWAPAVGWIPVDISEARKHPELKDYFFGNLSGNRILFSRARSFVLDGDGVERNYFVYPLARVDGRDAATAVEWTFRYSDVPKL